jgi:alpha-beta hydrolase superfamily lysophospholipase
MTDILNSTPQTDESYYRWHDAYQDWLAGDQSTEAPLKPKQLYDVNLETVEFSAQVIEGYVDKSVFRTELRDEGYKGNVNRLWRRLAKQGFIQKHGYVEQKFTDIIRQEGDVDAFGFAVKANRDVTVKEKAFATLSDSLITVPMELTGTLFIPEAPSSETPLAAIALIHHALGNQNQYHPNADYLASHGIAVFTPDMSGHGLSGGPYAEADERYKEHHVKMRDWNAVTRASINLLQQDIRIDKSNLGAHGVSSGATTLAEVAVEESNGLDYTSYQSPTFNDDLPWLLNSYIKYLEGRGRKHYQRTGSTYRKDFSAIVKQFPFTVDPQSDVSTKDAAMVDGYKQYPVTDSSDCIFVGDMAKTILPRQRIPAAIHIGKQDSLADVDSMTKAYEVLGENVSVRLDEYDAGHLLHADAAKNRKTQVPSYQDFNRNLLEWIITNSNDDSLSDSQTSSK